MVGVFSNKVFTFNLICVFVLFSMISYSNAEDFPDYTLSSTLDIRNEINNNIYVMKSGTDYNLKQVNVDVSFFPRNDYRQEVLDISTYPDSTTLKDSIHFQWNDVKEEEFEYRIKSNVRLNHSLYEIKDKIDFPIKDELKDYKEYLRETDTIDYQDPKIQKLASGLAKEEDDLFVVTHKYAEWVNTNVEYDLNSMTSSASQKASWVLDTRSGVCDELTNLFIAMCRSTGIPARFVTGLAYTTNENFPDRWSPHGWAEVYFPGYGWVPFDVTYGEMGYLDAGHMKLKDAVDANRSSTKFEWVGYNVNLRGGKTELNTEVTYVGENVTPLIKLDMKILKNVTDFGSYNALIINVTNDNDFYVPTQLYLSRTKEVEVFDGYRKIILLEPQSSRTIIWIFKIDENFDPDKYYTLPFVVRGFRGEEDTAELISKKEEKYYSLGDIKNLLPTTLEKNNNLTDDINMHCFMDKKKSISLDNKQDVLDYMKDAKEKEEEKTMIYKNINFTCLIYNNGNTEQALDFCFKDSCKKLELGIGSYEKIDQRFFANRTGIFDIIFSAKNEDINVLDEIALTVEREPEINVSTFNMPSEVSIKDKFDIEFHLDILEYSTAYDVNVNLKSSSFEKKWTMDEMDENKRFILEIDDHYLGSVDNEILLYATYKDSEGKIHSISEKKNIKVTDAGILDRIMMFFNRTNLELRNEMYILIITALFAGFLIGFVMRRGSRKKLETLEEEKEVEKEIKDEIVILKEEEIKEEKEVKNKEPSASSDKSKATKEKYIVKRK